MKVRLTITVDERTIEDMKKICNGNGQKISSVINLLIQGFINDETEKMQGL